MQMIPLPKEFTRKRFKYDLLQRSDAVAIYQKRHVDYPNDISFEVIEIQKRKDAVINLGGTEIHCKAKEAFPSDEQWGSKGWSYRDYVSAYIKFGALSQSHRDVMRSYAQQYRDWASTDIDRACHYLNRACHYRDLSLAQS